MKKPVLPALLFLLFVAPCFVKAQGIFINTADSLYILNASTLNCSYQAVTNLGLPAGEKVFTTAMSRDTLYLIGQFGNNLYRTRASDQSVCTFVTDFPVSGPFGSASTINSMTADKNGIIYALDGYTREVFRFQPKTGQKENLGALPYTPAGDVIFYNDKLLVSTIGGGIVEVNLADPSQSTVYMSASNYQFYGMISFPFDCTTNKAYGFSSFGGGTQVVELDLKNRLVGAVICSYPFSIWDAGSIVENGTTLGISIDSILIKAACLGANTGGVEIRGYSAAAGVLNYNLNSTITNTTGKFDGLLTGTYQLRVTNQQGCAADSSFVIAEGLKGPMTIIANDPESCLLQNGSVGLQASSIYSPLSFSINGGSFGSSGLFNGLPAGRHTLAVKDQGGCRLDSIVDLAYKVRPDFVGDIIVTPTTCEALTGEIKISTTGSETGIRASLNNGAAQPNLHFTNLDAGDYLLSVYNASSCRFDSVITISKLIPAAPIISVSATSQICFVPNGKVNIAASGAGAPFSFSLNNSAPGPNQDFTNLSPGIYPIAVIDKYKCRWDSSVEVIAYPRVPVTVDISTKDPDCKTMNGGHIILRMSGQEAPYTTKWQNNTFSNGSPVLLPAGRYALPVINRDGCVVDSARATLTLIVEPECDRMSVPNAFTPDGNGKNDLFKPIHGPFLKHVKLVIYNRYGQVVFRNSETKPGWDGTINRQAAASGTYVWTLNYETYSGEQRTQKGLVNLIR